MYIVRETLKEMKILECGQKGLKNNWKVSYIHRDYIANNGNFEMDLSFVWLADYASVKEFLKTLNKKNFAIWVAKYSRDYKELNEKRHA